MSQTDIPTELRYTAEHEWVQRTGPTTVRVGVTDYAQSQLGDVVFVQLPTEDDLHDFEELNERAQDEQSGDGWLRSV